jgi:preprotein translocase subunit SecG
MGFIIGLLTFVMVLDCVVLVLLVLIQLPKKDAGAGLAFGGAASDALFGAGSGNVLTKITKYAATIFFVMALGLSILQTRYHTRTSSAFEQKLEQTQAAPFGATPPATAPATTPVVPLTSSTNALTSVPQAETTNAPAAGTTPAPQK